MFIHDQFCKVWNEKFLADLIAKAKWYKIQLYMDLTESAGQIRTYPAQGQS